MIQIRVTDTDWAVYTAHVKFGSNADGLLEPVTRYTGRSRGDGDLILIRQGRGDLGHVNGKTSGESESSDCGITKVSLIISSRVRS